MKKKTKKKIYFITPEQFVKKICGYYDEEIKSLESRKAYIRENMSKLPEEIPVMAIPKNIPFSSNDEWFDRVVLRDCRFFHEPTKDCQQGKRHDTNFFGQKAFLTEDQL